MTIHTLSSVSPHEIVYHTRFYWTSSTILPLLTCNRRFPLYLDRLEGVFRNENGIFSLQELSASDFDILLELSKCVVYRSAFIMGAVATTAIDLATENKVNQA